MQTEHYYPADLYELVHRGTPGDLAYYRRACAGADRILELGCGYGRVLAALADLGASVIGLDRDAGLLASARARLRSLAAAERSRIELVHGDMTDFRDRLGGRRFDRILIPHSGLYCLPSDEACEACFRCVADHLAPSGRLILDAYVADDFHATADPKDHLDEQLEPVVSVEHQGVVYDVLERSHWDRARQRIDVTYEYVPRGGGEVLQGSIAHRYLVGGQLEPLLRRGGLELVTLQNDWDAQPQTPAALDPTAEFYVAVAVAARQTSAD